MKIITLGKTVPYKYCLGSWNSSTKKDFDTDVLFNYNTAYFQVLCVTFIEHVQNVNKHNIS